MIDFENIEEDSNIINNAYYDILIIYLDGTVKKRSAKPALKQIFDNNELCQNLGYYKLYNGKSVLEYLYFNQLPTEEKPTVIKEDTINMVLFPLNKNTIRTIIESGGPKILAEKYLTNQINISDVGLKYRLVNLSNRPLYIANFGKVETMPNENPERLRAYLWEFDLTEEYEAMSDRYDLIIRFTTTTSMKLDKNNVKKMDVIWFEKDNINGPLRPKDDKVDDISVFCSWAAANNFLNEYKNTRNYIISKTANYFDEEREEAVAKQKLSNKKDMIALAKICASFVGSGIIYAAVKLLLAKIFPPATIFKALMATTKTSIIMKMSVLATHSRKFKKLLSVLEWLNLKLNKFKVFIDNILNRIPVVKHVYKGIKYVIGRLFSDEDSFLRNIIKAGKRVVSNVKDTIFAGLFNVVAFVFRF